MIYQSPVLITDIPARCYPKKTASGATYLYAHVGDKYNPEKQYSVPVRIAIGKLDPEDSTKLLPNANFFKLFPEVTVTDDRDPIRRRNQSIGTFLLIQQLVAELGIETLMQKSFGDSAALIFDLASCMIVNEDRAMDCYGDFVEYAASHPLFSKGQHVVSESTITSFLTNISNSARVDRFIRAWVKKNKHPTELYLLCDAASKDFSLGEIEFVEPGHFTAKAGSRLWAYALGLDKEQCLPLFYLKYACTHPSHEQVQELLCSAKEHGYKQVTFIIERGFWSLQNIYAMDELGCNFIMRLSAKHALVVDLIDAHLLTNECDSSTRVSNDLRVHGKTVEHEFAGRKRYFHIYHDLDAETREVEELQSCLSNDEINLKRSQGYILSNASAFEDYFELHLDKDGKLEGYCINDEAVSCARRRAGHYVIITSEKMTAKDVYMLLMKRDQSDSLFSDKSAFLDALSNEQLQSDMPLIDFLSSLEQTDDLERTKMFIKFISLLIKTKLLSQLQNCKLALDETHPMAHALWRLSKLSATRDSQSGEYVLDIPFPKWAKDIYEAVGLSETKLSKRVQKLLNQMSQAEIQYEETIEL